MQGLLAHLWKIALITEVGMSFTVTQEVKVTR